MTREWIQEEEVGVGGARDWNGPTISSLGAPVCCHANLIPTNKITSPIAPPTGFCHSRNGEASPNNARAPRAAKMLIFGLPLDADGLSRVTEPEPELLASMVLDGGVGGAVGTCGGLAAFSFATCEM